MNGFVFHLVCVIPPGACQHFKKICLSDLHDNICIRYSDDIIAFSSTLDEHLTNLRKVLRRLREYGATLKPRQYKLFHEDVNVLRLVSTWSLWSREQATGPLSLRSGHESFLLQLAFCLLSSSTELNY